MKFSKPWLSVVLSTIIGVFLAACVFAILLFVGIQGSANSLQSGESAPNTFLLDVTFQPHKRTSQSEISQGQEVWPPPPMPPGIS
jgi:hypothetical protein